MLTLVYYHEIKKSPGYLREKKLMPIILWDYYRETNFLIYQITEVKHFLVSYRLKRNLKAILNFTPNTRELLKSILKRDTQKKLKIKTTRTLQITYPLRSSKYK